MTKHTWTPDAVHELVKDWPDLARASIGWAPGRPEPRWVQLDGNRISADLAAAAHVASGIEWWYYRNGATDRLVVWDDSGPTLLHAVSAAIMAAGGDSHP